MTTLLKLSGVILLIGGIILTIKPDFFCKIATTPDPYQMIEKRVMWGILIGLGGFLIINNSWSSFGLIPTVLLLSMTIGIILARLTGFVLDGFFTKQLYWLLVEIAVLLILGLWYFKQKY
jgi:hypothetical protein